MNLAIAEHIKAFADVFVPQRDGKLLKQLIADGQPIDIAREIVYQGDIRAIGASDCLVAVLDGRTIDEGTAFELGYARALDKYCIGLKTDDRLMLPSGDNPMIVSGYYIAFSSILATVLTDPFPSDIYWRPTSLRFHSPE